MVILWSLEFANHKQSLVSSSGGGGNRTAGSSPDSDDSRTVSRTSIDENTSKENESLKLTLDEQGGATLFVVSAELPKEGL